MNRVSDAMGNEVVTLQCAKGQSAKGSLRMGPSETGPSEMGCTVRICATHPGIGPSPATWRAIGRALTLQPASDPGIPADLCIQLTDALPPRRADATRLRQDARGTVWQHASGQHTSGWRVERASHAAHLDRDAPPGLTHEITMKELAHIVVVPTRLFASASDAGPGPQIAL